MTFFYGRCFFGFEKALFLASNLVFSVPATETPEGPVPQSNPMPPQGTPDSN